MAEENINCRNMPKRSSNMAAMDDETSRLIITTIQWSEAVGCSSVNRGPKSDEQFSSLMVVQGNDVDDDDDKTAQSLPRRSP